MKTPVRFAPLTLALAAATASLHAAPPVVYTGTTQATTTADGGLRPVIGVHNIKLSAPTAPHLIIKTVWSTPTCTRRCSPTGAATSISNTSAAPKTSTTTPPRRH